MQNDNIEVEMNRLLEAFKEDAKKQTKKASAKKVVKSEPIETDLQKQMELMLQSFKNDLEPEKINRDEIEPEVEEDEIEEVEETKEPEQVPKYIKRGNEARKKSKISSQKMFKGEITYDVVFEDEKKDIYGEQLTYRELFNEMKPYIIDSLKTSPKGIQLCRNTSANTEEEKNYLTAMIFSVIKASLENVKTINFDSINPTATYLGAPSINVQGICSNKFMLETLTDFAMVFKESYFTVEETLDEPEEVKGTEEPVQNIEPSDQPMVKTLTPPTAIKEPIVKTESVEPPIQVEQPEEPKQPQPIKQPDESDEFEELVEFVEEEPEPVPERLFDEELSQEPFDGAEEEKIELIDGYVNDYHKVYSMYNGKVATTEQGKKYAVDMATLKAECDPDILELQEISCAWYCLISKTKNKKSLSNKDWKELEKFLLSITKALRGEYNGDIKIALIQNGFDEGLVNVFMGIYKFLNLYVQHAKKLLLDNLLAEQELSLTKSQNNQPKE